MCRVPALYGSGCFADMGRASLTSRSIATYASVSDNGVLCSARTPLIGLFALSSRISF
jgi:hypothetical protein